MKAFTGPGTRLPGQGDPDFWIRSGNDVYYNVSGGNIGIGTDNPGTRKLKVVGDLEVATGKYYGDGSELTGISGASQLATSTSCTTAAASEWTSCTTPSCPSGYVRSGCSFRDSTGWASTIIDGAGPSGDAACECRHWNEAAGPVMTCYTYCIK